MLYLQLTWAYTEVFHTPSTGEQKWESMCSGCSLQVNNMVLPFMPIQVQRLTLKALIDTRCEQSVIQKERAKELKLFSRGPVRQVLMLNVQTTTCKGKTSVTVKIGSHQSMSVQC